MRTERSISGASRLAASIALPVALAACAQTSDSTRQTTHAPAAPIHNDCMFARTLRDWRPLDDENLLLFGPGHTAYLVQLVRPIVGLSFNIMIGVYDRDGSICPYGGDAIVIRGPMPERVSIRSMQRLDDAGLDDVYVRFGIRPPAVVTAEPAELEKGAQQ
jgi:Family of unknown function (DUF6491)